MNKKYYWCDMCPTKHENKDLTLETYWTYTDSSDLSPSPVKAIYVDVCNKCRDKITQLTTCECGERCVIDNEGTCSKCLQKLEDNYSV